MRIGSWFALEHDAACILYAFDFDHT
jgi:hypothetical protein